jgi:hypothetical protein
MRIRKFDPRSFFLSMLHLVSGTNAQGYPRALRKAWLDIPGSAVEPVKSSLSKIRAKVSHTFFSDRFEELNKTILPNRRTFRGLHVYAIDGQESSIPLSDEILEAGFRGRSRVDKKETYYPRIYMSQIFDVVNEVIVGVTHSCCRNENRDALILFHKAEKNSVIIYDRAYACSALLDAHCNKGSYFVIRCRSGGTFKEIIQFYKSSKMETTWNYKGLKIRLFKVKNPKGKGFLVLATNLPGSWGNREIGQLYFRRWGIETSFRDAAQQAMGHWHSKSVNGLIQELFVRLWLLNYARLQLMMESKTNPQDWLKPKYTKANLKLLVELMIEGVPLVLRRRFKMIIDRIDDLIRRTLQTRTHFKRKYQRVLKNSGITNFPYQNTVARRS